MPQADELKKLAKWAHTGRMFDMPELTVKSRALLQEVRAVYLYFVRGGVRVRVGLVQVADDMGAIRELWKCIADFNLFFATCREGKWSELNTDKMEDACKQLQKVG